VRKPEAAGRGHAAARAYTVADGYRTVMNVLMVVMGIVILARTLPYGLHVQALLVGLGFVALGAYRLSFVMAYLRRRRTAR
jgi:heme A synthase